MKVFSAQCLDLKKKKPPHPQLLRGKTLGLSSGAGFVAQEAIYKKFGLQYFHY